MINIFESFLPQLLRYPNPTDPLNGEAAALMMRDAKQYEAKVKGGRNLNMLIARSVMLTCIRSDYVKRFASKDAADEAGEESDSEDEMSSAGSIASGEDEEAAGQMDDL